MATPANANAEKVAKTAVEIRITRDMVMTQNRRIRAVPGLRLVQIDCKPGLQPGHNRRIPANVARERGGFKTQNGF